MSSVEEDLTQELSELEENRILMLLVEVWLKKINRDQAHDKMNLFSNSFFVDGRMKIFWMENGIELI